MIIRFCSYEPGEYNSGTTRTTLLSSPTTHSFTQPDFTAALISRQVCSCGPRSSSPAAPPCQRRSLGSLPPAASQATRALVVATFDASKGIALVRGKLSKAEVVAYLLADALGIEILKEEAMIGMRLGESASNGPEI